MKQIEVVAAIIRKGDKIFATQRGYGEWKDWWEFPGGKMEAGETPEEALVREIREELSTEISVDEFLCTVEHDYPKFHLKMHCYLCSLVTEALHLNEHEAAKWLTKDELDGVNWLPADMKVVENLELYDNPEELTFPDADVSGKESENEENVRKDGHLTDKMSDKQALKDRIRRELSDKANVYSKLSDKMSDIVVMAVSNEFITTSMVVSQFDIDERNARRYLTRLVDLGYLIAKGENKNKKYRYKEQ